MILLHLSIIFIHLHQINFCPQNPTKYESHPRIHITSKTEIWTNPKGTEHLALDWYYRESEKSKQSLLSS